MLLSLERQWTQITSLTHIGGNKIDTAELRDSGQKFSHSLNHIGDNTIDTAEPRERQWKKLPHSLKHIGDNMIDTAQPREMVDKYYLTHFGL